MSCITDDIFGVENQVIQEISIDEPEETRSYMLTLYKRLRRIENGPTDDEVISSNSNSLISTSITFSEDSFEGDLPRPEEASRIEVVRVLDQDLPVPIFKNNAALRR